MHLVNMLREGSLRQARSCVQGEPPFTASLAILVRSRVITAEPGFRPGIMVRRHGYCYCNDIVCESEGLHGSHTCKRKLGPITSDIPHGMHYP